MRPLAAFVEAANRFRSEVAVVKEGLPPANGKSLMSLLGLAAEQGTVLVLEVSGPDAEEALRALVEAIERTCED